MAGRHMQVDRFTYMHGPLNNNRGREEQARLRKIADIQAAIEAGLAHAH